MINVSDGFYNYIYPLIIGPVFSNAMLTLWGPYSPAAEAVWPIDILKCAYFCNDLFHLHW